MSVLKAPITVTLTPAALILPVPFLALVTTATLETVSLVPM